MPIPDAAALLAGFVLAHAAWSASDLPRGELVAPLAIVEQNGERELHRFEAPTQAEAVARGKKAMTDATARADAWAFAREGPFNREGQKVDMLVVDFWAKGMASPATIMQQFEPFTTGGRFKIIGEPLLVLDGQPQTDGAAQAVIARLREGIRSHPKVASLWDSWQ
jgi:hypothetical protein